MSEKLAISILENRDKEAYISSIIRSYNQYKAHLSESDWILYVQSLIDPIKNDESDITYVVKDRDVIVGGLQIYFGAQKAYQLEHLAIDGPIIRFLFVDPSSQGKGIAQQLLQFVYDQLAERGYSEVHLHSGEMMQKSIALYQYLGYERVPTKDFYIDEFPIYGFKYQFVKHRQVH